jgi:hypothetical protein
MAGSDARKVVDAGFEFAFDNEAFSDKVLRIEVVGSSDCGPESCADTASNKRCREEAEGAYVQYPTTISITILDSIYSIGWYMHTPAWYLPLVIHIVPLFLYAKTPLGCPKYPSFENGSPVFHNIRPVFQPFLLF